jgi:hypothetical protein
MDSMRFSALALTLCAALGAASPALAQASAQPSFRCPGTNAAFFEEVQENGWWGYGETWDLKTCDQGNEVYAPALADRRWRAFRRMPRAPVDEADVAFYSTIFPAVAFGGLGGVFVIAWLLAAVQRRRKTRYVHLACTACDLTMDAPEVDTRLHSMFCPKCGSPCQVEA